MREQSQRHHYMVSKAPTVFKQMQKSRQFSVCKLCLLCHLAATPIVQCSITPHECLQAVARTHWMKGNLLFTRKSPTCAITPKASHDRQLCSYLQLITFFIVITFPKSYFEHIHLFAHSLQATRGKYKTDLGKNSSSQEQCSICVEAGLPFLSNPLFQTQHNTHFRLTLLQLEDHQGRRNLVHRQTTEVFQELLDHTDGASGGSES